MNKRSLRRKYAYGSVLEKESQAFKKDLHDRLKLDKFFKNKNILDLGCGFGTDSIYFCKIAKKVVGVDIEEYPEWKLFKEKNLKFVKASSSKLPFKDNEFDSVYLKDLLHHVEDVEGTLSEIKRVTKRDGHIIVLEGNRFNPLFLFYVTKIRGHDHFTQKEFIAMTDKMFPAVKYVFLEAYPPFCFPMGIYKLMIGWGRAISKVSFLKSFFSYNCAIIANKK